MSFPQRPNGRPGTAHVNGVDVQCIRGFGQSTSVLRWRKPGNSRLYSLVDVYGQAGGGGGGSGRKGTGALRTGGSGGGAGARFWATFAYDLLPSDLILTNPYGGNGAAAQTTNNTNGLAASGAGNATIQLVDGRILFNAGGGDPGQGGTTTTATAGGAGQGFSTGVAGGAAGAAAVVGASGAQNAVNAASAGGGASGGAVSAGGVATAGAFGGGPFLQAAATGLWSGFPGNADTDTDAQPDPPWTQLLSMYMGGRGGASGGGSNIGPGGRGADAWGGGGGGGGGAGTDSVGDSGAGGRGGDGYYYFVCR